MLRCHILKIFSHVLPTPAQHTAHNTAASSCLLASPWLSFCSLGLQGKNHLGGAARAAEDIARQTARELLGPLLDAACSRLAFTLRRALDIAADKCLKHGA
jgi:hypothetical protein